VAPKGRRPLIRGVHSFEDLSTPVPNELLIDTSFALRTIVTTEALHVECQAYVYRILQAGATVWYSEMLEIELAEKAYQLALKETYGKTWMSARHDGRARRKASRRMLSWLSAWNEMISALPAGRIEISEVSDLVPKLMTLGLASYDAVHAAAAHYMRVSSILTTDSGFAYLPPSTQIYTDSTRVNACRKIRGGTAH
jgi:predicted nucleic acid-binding protein